MNDEGKGELRLFQITTFVFILASVAFAAGWAGAYDDGEEPLKAAQKAEADAKLRLDECRRDHPARVVQRCIGSQCEDAYESLLGEIDQCKVALKDATEHPSCPPPPPGCTESGQLAQCSSRLDECQRDLNFKVQTVSFGDWFAQMQEQADEKIVTLRDQYFTLLEEFLPVKARAVEMGLGPRVRDWITKPGAAELFIEIGARWAEIELVYARMKQVIQDADDAAQRVCYRNITWSWAEIMPDERDHDRLQQEAYGLTDGKYFVYLYELERAARNREAQQP